MSSSRQLPDNCTVVVKNLRSGDGERIKSYCHKRTPNLTGGFAVVFEKKNPPFDGACRMFIDYSSGKAALQAMDDLVPFLRDHYGPSRPIKPLAYIKGGDTSGRGADKAGSKSERKAAVTATRPVAERANDSDFWLWIGNLPKDAADIEIKPMFACYGPVHGIKVHAGEARSSAIITYASYEGACSATAALSQGLLFKKARLKCDVGVTLGFVLDVLMGLREAPSISFNDVLVMRRNQKWQPTFWQEALLKAGLDIDNDTQVVRCPPGRKVTSAEDLAINFRMGHPSKFAKKGGASASQASTPERKGLVRTSTQEKTFAQVIGRDEGDALWKVLSDPSLEFGAELSMPVNALVFELVGMYGQKGIEGTELAGLLKHVVSIEAPLCVRQLRKYLSNYPEFDIRADGPDTSFWVMTAAFSDAGTPKVISQADMGATLAPEDNAQNGRNSALSLGDELIGRRMEADAEYRDMMLEICNKLLQNPRKEQEEHHHRTAQDEYMTCSLPFNMPLDRSPVAPALQGPSGYVPDNQKPLSSFASPGMPDHPPDAFICPISHQLLVDPVTTIDGYTYSRAYITEWLARHDTSPMTNNLLLRDGKLDKTLCPNYALKTAVNQWVQQEPRRTVEEWLKGQPPRVLPSLSSLPDTGQDIGTFTSFVASEDPSRTFFEQGPRTDASSDSPAVYSSLGFNPKPLLEMTVEDVCALFHHCKFPTSGVLQGSVDGPTLFYLYSNSEQTLTLPAPEGLGLTPLQVKARLTSEMSRLLPSV